MRFPLAATLAVLTLLAAAPGASAGTLAKVGSTYVYTATANELNDLAVADAGADLSFDETGAVTVALAPGSGCAGGGAAAATCPEAGITAIVVDLGDRDDELAVNASVTLPVQGAGGAGDDELTGGAGQDDLDGDAGADMVVGMDGEDEVRGGEGPDIVVGANGSDRLFGDGGNDLFSVEDGADVVSGGTGFDALLIEGGGPTAVPYSLDDVANDGLAPFVNVLSDVEQLQADDRDAVTTLDLVLTGNERPNTLRGGSGDDVIDGRGGADVLSGGEGDDELRARDGVIDHVTCGAGTDSATVDFDDVVEECETVDRSAAPAGPAPPPAAPAGPAAPAAAPSADDLAPSVAFLAPASDALLDPRRTNAIVVSAADDRGVDRVVLFDDGRPVGIDATAPYTFDYTPTGDDVGRNTLVAVASDGAGQTASAIRALRLGRFPVRSRSLKVTPRRDRTSRYRFRATGRIRLFPSVSRRLGCGSGRVSVRIKRGSRTLSSRRVALRDDCTFRSTVTFSSRRRLGNGRLRVVARFLGNAVLRPTPASTRRVRAG